MTTETVVSNSSIINHIRNSWTYLSKGRFTLVPKSGLFGHNLDDAIGRLARKLNAPVLSVRSRVLRLKSMGLLIFTGDRLVVAKDKIASGMYKMTRPSLKVVPPTKPEGIDYEAINAKYEAQVFDDDLQRAFGHLKPATMKAYAELLRADMAVA